MKYEISQCRQGKDGKEHYPRVASCDLAEDAIMLAAGLAQRSPGSVHVNAYHKGRHAFGLLCITNPKRSDFEIEIGEAILAAPKKLKAWKKEEKEKKRRVAAICHFREEHFTWDQWSKVRDDAAFSACLFARPHDFEAALARAREMGIEPQPSQQAA